MRSTRKTSVDKPEEIDHVGDLGVDGSNILFFNIIFNYASWIYLSQCRFHDTFF